jgi:Peptidase propeptide and YPEB domain
MKRTTLMVAAAGVVLAATGAAIGVATAGASGPSPETSLVADGTTPSVPPFPSETELTASPSPSDVFPSETFPSDVFPSESATARHTGRVDADKASGIALARAGGGQVVDIEAEAEHGRPVWKVELVKGGAEYRVDVDRETGGILRFRLEDGGRGGDDRHGDDNSGRG